MTFWKTASKAQKLAQIDAGIELGMTARQVALNLGTTISAVSQYANENGRKFTAKNNNVSKQFVNVQRILKARRHGAPNTAMKDAFDIFGVKESKWEMEL